MYQERASLASRMASERGAILVYTAVVLLTLVGITMWVVDYGVLLLARNQAQNSADGGALGGAVALAFDNFADRTNTGPAKQSAHALALDNEVIAQPPDVDITTDVYFYPDDPPKFPAVCSTNDSCIRVDVYRNQARGNPLPIFFGAIVGMTDQGTWATATARAVFGRATDCLLPFAIPDRWVEWREDEANSVPPFDNPLNFPYDEPAGDVWDPQDSFDAYDSKSLAPLPGPVDLFDPNTDGFDPYRDHGVRVELKSANKTQIANSWYYPIVLPDGWGRGARNFRDRITGCSPVEVPEDYVFENEPGNMRGPTRKAIGDLVLQDPGATWDPFRANLDGTRGAVVGGCMGAVPPTCGVSPRIRPVAVFDADNYLSGKRTGRLTIQVTGFVGVFVEGMVGDAVTGYLTTLRFDPTATNQTDDTSSWLRSVLLIR